MPAKVVAGQQTKDKPVQEYRQWLRASAGEALRTVLPLKVIPMSLRVASQDAQQPSDAVQDGGNDTNEGGIHRKGKDIDIPIAGAKGISVHVEKEHWNEITGAVADSLSETSANRRRYRNYKFMKRLRNLALDASKFMLYLTGSNAILVFSSAFSIREVIDNHLVIVSGLLTLGGYWIYYATSLFVARTKKLGIALRRQVHQDRPKQKAMLRNYGIPDVS